MLRTWFRSKLYGGTDRMGRLMTQKWLVILLLTGFIVGSGCMTGPPESTGPEALDGNYSTPLDAENIRQQLEAIPSGSLSDTEQADILFIREEEKLARDVYLVFSDRWQLRVFENIAGAEQTHMDSVGVLVERYGLEDTVQAKQGVFTNTTLQALYDTFVSEGTVSEVAALRAGAQIEETDLADLQEARDRTDNQDVQLVYDNLMRGSRNHLRAYVTTLEQRGESYTPTELDPEAFDGIVSSPVERGP